MSTNLKVLLIDPWGTNNTSEYLNGLILGLSTKTELTVFTNKYFEDQTNVCQDIHRVFFGLSENMKQGKIRKIIRGIEYLFAYQHIINYIKKEHFDIVHINWLLRYPIDIKNLKKIKKLNVKLIYTAHNVLPHTNGESSKNELEEIYSIVDRIIVHGENIKEEMVTLFPNTAEKIYVQKHGAILVDPDQIDLDVLNNEIRENAKDIRKYF